MNLPGFMDISQSLLQENALQVRFGGDTAFSFPLPAIRGGKLLDAMFLYSTAESKLYRNGEPMAWIMLDSADGEPVLLAERMAQDFIPQDFREPDFSRGLTLQEPVEQARYTREYHQLYEIYERLRQFAFEELLTPEQIAVRDIWKDLFYRLVYVQHLPFYQALSPEFFIWIGMQAPDRKPVELPDEPKEDIFAGMEPDVAEALKRLSRQFADRIAMDRRKDAIFDAMHAELQHYKRGMLDSLTDPLERDIIRMIDDISRIIESFRGQVPTRENYLRFFSMFEGVQTDLADLLYRNGVEPYTLDEDVVDTLRQQIVGKVVTTDPKQDGTVERRISQGWEKNGRIIRPERVSAYVWTPSVSEEPGR